MVKQVRDWTQLSPHIFTASRIALPLIPLHSFSKRFSALKLAWYEQIVPRWTGIAELTYAQAWPAIHWGLGKWYLPNLEPVACLQECHNFCQRGRQPHLNPCYLSGSVVQHEGLIGNTNWQ